MFAQLTWMACVLLAVPEGPEPETLPPAVRQVLDDYMKAVGAEDAAAMAKLAATPWLDVDRKLVRDGERLAAALARAAGQSPSDGWGVFPISYRDFRETVEDKADRELFDALLGEDGWLIALADEDDLFGSRVVLIRVRDGKPLVVGGPLKENQFLPRNKIPASVDRLLSEATSFEVISLDPARTDDEGKPIEVKDGFHGWRILGRTEVKGEAERERLAEALRAGAEANFGVVAGCFIPRHGLRLKADGRTTDLVICFQCFSVQVFEGGADPKQFLVTHDPQVAFDAVLRRAGVPLPRPADEDDDRD